MKLALLAALAACKSHVASCEDDLTGEWHTPGGVWMVIDDNVAVEAYPVFDDLRPGAAPRVIDLPRPSLLGEVHRRYGLCDARAAARVTSCGDDRLELVLADPLPCGSAGAAPSHREAWSR